MCQPNFPNISKRSANFPLNLCTRLKSWQGVLFPSAGFLSVFTFLVALQPPEAFEGLLVIPVLLSGRLGPRAGLIGAVTAVGLHSLVLSATVTVRVILAMLNFPPSPGSERVMVRFWAEVL